MFIPLIISDIEQLDDKAFMTNLYKNHYKAMRKEVYNITGSLENFDDISQEAFVNLIKKISLLRTLECCTLRAYIVITIKRTCLNYINSQKTRSKYTTLGQHDDAYEEIAASVEDNSENVEMIAEKNFAIEELTNVLFELSERDRMILEFKYILDMGDAEIAKSLGIKPQSVREYLTRARRKAFKLLSERGMYNV